MPPVVLPIAEYLPDLPDFPAEGSSTVRNVYPKTAKSYGPIGSPMIFMNALNSRCQGGAALPVTLNDITADRTTVVLFAGDANDLYLHHGGNAIWIVCSQTPGMYHTDPKINWQFVYFNGDIIATNYADAPQLISSALTQDLSADAPKGKYIGVVKNSFVVLCDTNDPVNGVMPQRVWWSAAGDHRNWPTPGTAAAAQVQAGATDLLGDGGEIRGIATDLANADAIIFQEFASKRMTYSGPPNFFSFQPIENARGTPAPYSIIVIGGVVFFLGQDGFYMHDGVTSKPIGADKVDKTFFADLDYANIHRVVGAADPQRKMAWWAYPGAGSSSGNPNHLLGYNWALDRWSICDVTCETLVRLLSIGYTLDELYTVLGYTIDGLPAPLDSPVWIGGLLQLGVFDTAHKLNYLTGPNLAAQVDTSEMQPAAGRRMLVRNSRPLVDGTAPSVKIGRRERLQDTVQYTQAVSLNSLGACPVRTSGRYLRASVAIPAADPWSELSGVELDLEPQGAR